MSAPIPPTTHLDRERAEKARERWREVAPPALRFLLDCKPASQRGGSQ